MNISSIQVKDEISIAYTDPNQQAGKEDRLKVVSAEEPRPELRANMDALAPYVCEMLELEEDYADGMTIQRVAIERKGSRKIYKISGYKELTKSKTTFRFTTPPRADIVDEGGKDFAIPKDCIVVLQTVENEAERYVKGDRSQSQLPLDD